MADANLCETCKKIYELSDAQSLDYCNECYKLTKLSVPELVQECIRRKRIAEKLWMTITKIFGAEGLKKVMAHRINNIEG